jgi:hypothetical protein
MYIGRTLPEAPVDMRAFDPLAVVKVATAHLATLSDPRQRAILENFIEHATAEATGDYPRLMASCSRKRQSYTAWGAGADYAAHLPQDYAALERHYHGLIEANLYLIHFEVEKLCVGRDTLFVEGIVHQLYPGALVEPIFGFAVADPAGVYQLSKRTALSFVFDEDGLGCGEHAYSDGPTTPANLVPVPREQVPAAFWNNPLRPG